MDYVFRIYYIFLIKTILEIMARDYKTVSLKSRCSFYLSLHQNDWSKNTGYARFPGDPLQNLFYSIMYLNTNALRKQEKTLGQWQRSSKPQN